MNRQDEKPAPKKAIRSAVAAAAAVAAFGLPEWIRTMASPGEILGEFARSLLIVCLLANLLERARARSWKDTFLTGFRVCTFQGVILLGSVIHEHKPLAAYATRAGYVVGSTLLAVAVLGLLRGLAPEHSSRTAAGVAPATAVARAAPQAGVNHKAIVLASVAALLVGGLWYSPLLFGGAWAHLKAGASEGVRMPLVEGLGELVRSGIVAYLLARFVVSFELTAGGSLLLGGILWLGFHSTLLLFSVLHEHMPVALFALHAGHGLVNDLVIAAIVGAWRGEARAKGSSESRSIRATQAARS
jgi:hypothetical protein